MAQDTISSITGVKKTLMYHPSSSLAAASNNVAKVQQGAGTIQPANNNVNNTAPNITSGQTGTVSAGAPPVIPEVWYKKYLIYELIGVIILLMALGFLLLIKKKKQ